MAIPLTSVTQQPVRFNTLRFGGDDREVGRSGVIGTLVSWELNPGDGGFLSAMKAHVIFFVKQAFAFLDYIEIGSCFFGGLREMWEECCYLQRGPERNRSAREAVVEALGGTEYCRTIPVIQLGEADLTGYLKLDGSHFATGQSVIQGEDPAGRKFVALHVQDRATHQFNVITIHQRYRETTIKDIYIFTDGSLWVLNGPEGPQPDSDNPTRREEILNFIRQVQEGTQPQYILTPKP